MAKLRVAVLMGGVSSEREISLLSGQMVRKHCPRDKYITFPLDPKDLLDKSRAKRFLSRLLTADVAFIALHGPLGEDGTIQGLLEVLGIPYTGSGVLASALALDKVKSKEIFTFHNIPTPPWVVLSSQDPLPSLSYPVVVKPQRQGSSVGVSIVETPEQLPLALQTALRYDPLCIVEKYIEGREISTPILEIDGEPKALPIVEIIPKEGFYDYYHKYTENATQEIVPAPLEEEVKKEVEKVSLSAYNALGCSGFARVDLRLDQNGSPFVLEVNTIPGLTPLSLLPLSAKSAGISFPQLVDIIIQNALSKRRK